MASLGKNKQILKKNLIPLTSNRYYMAFKYDILIYLPQKCFHMRQNYWLIDLKRL